MKISFARSATKHRVSRVAAAHVILRADRWIEEPPPSDGEHRSVRRLYVGRDPAGRLLEVMAVERDDGSVLIIHAMSIRSRTLKKWRESNR